jgi:hypothetical protein
MAAVHDGVAEPVTRGEEEGVREVRKTEELFGEEE